MTLAFASLRQNYADLWSSMEIRPSKAADIEATAHKVLDAKNGRYKAVETATTVPWYVCGIIHQLECGGNFAQHLFNGDPLNERTTHVPRGMPQEGDPPFSWKESACAAMRYDGLDKVEKWSIERILFELEKYNGEGYRLHHPDVNTPYLWSGTNHYSRGKYVADGAWSSDAVSGQSGAAAILKRCMELDADVCPEFESETAAKTVEDGKTGAEAFYKAVPPPPDHPLKIAVTSVHLWSFVIGAGAVIGDGVKQVCDAVGDLFGHVPDISAEVDQFSQPATHLLDIMRVNSGKLNIAICLVCLAVALIHEIDRHAHAKKGN